MCDAPLDQTRAGGIALQQAQLKLADQSPMVIDLKPLGGSQPGFHWILEHCSLMALCTERGPSLGTPVSGLFLCPPNTPAAETLLQAQDATLGLIMEARGLVLPVTERAIPFETLPSNQFVVNVTLSPGFKATVPGGWFLRAILNCLPGSPTPGPGINSFGLFKATALLECDPTQNPQ